MTRDQVIECAKERTTMSKDFRVLVRVKNNLLLEKIEEAGYDSISEFSRACGVAQTTVGHFVNMQKSPINSHNGEYSQAFMKIVDFLKCMPEDVFPEKLMDKKIKGYKKEFKIDADDLVSSLRSLTIEPEKKMIMDQAEQNFKTLLKEKISSREYEILKMRFGLDGSEKYTLEEVGEKFNLSGERVRSIEAGAMRKFKSPSTFRQTRSILEDYTSARD